MLLRCQLLSIRKHSYVRRLSIADTLSVIQAKYTVSQRLFRWHV